MLDRKIREDLAKELEVPESVRERVKYTLDDVRLSSFGKHETLEDKNRTRSQRKIYGKGVAAAVCLILASSITVTAAVVKWNPEFVEKFYISEELQEKLSSEGVAYVPLQTIEWDGISVSLEQCLTDNEFFCCLFKITVPEGARGYFNSIEVEGYKKEDIVKYSTISWWQEDNSCYYMIWGEHATLKNIDLDEEKKGEDVINYDNVVQGSCVTEEDYKTGYMTFRFKDFGKQIYGETDDFKMLASGPWEFQWAEKKVELKKEYAMNQKVSNGYYAKSNAILKNIVISPIMVSTVFDIPDRPEDKGNLSIYPAVATAVELKDGNKVTLNQYRADFEDYLDDGNNNFRYSFFLNAVIEPEQVVAIYFGDARIELQQ